MRARAARATLARARGAREKTHQPSNDIDSTIDSNTRSTIVKFYYRQQCSKSKLYIVLLNLVTMIYHVIYCGATGANVLLYLNLLVGTAIDLL
jgi:hypothetical protein